MHYKLEYLCMGKKMYLWVILATFITLLYSYNLSVRPDMDRVYPETRARVVIDKLMAQHNALKDYLTSLETTKTGLSYLPYSQGDGINVTASPGSNYLGKGADDNDTMCKVPERTSEVNGIPQINMKDISCREAIFQYLPLGYKIDTSSDEKPISKIYCVNADDESQLAGSCNDPNTKIFIISYQTIPSRWLNKKTLTPGADFMGAISKVAGYGRSIGIVENDGGLFLSGGQRVSEFTDGTEHVTSEKRALPGVLSNDSDFTDLRCTEDGTKQCFLEIQQIYK